MQKLAYAWVRMTPGYLLISLLPPPHPSTPTSSYFYPHLLILPPLPPHISTPTSSSFHPYLLIFLPLPPHPLPHLFSHHPRLLSEERIRNGVKKLQKSKQGATQERLDSFFKAVPSPAADKRKVCIAAVHAMCGWHVCLPSVVWCQARMCMYS